MCSQSTGSSPPTAGHHDQRPHSGRRSYRDANISDPSVLRRRRKKTAEQIGNLNPDILVGSDNHPLVISKGTSTQRGGAGRFRTKENRPAPAVLAAYFLEPRTPAVPQLRKLGFSLRYGICGILQTDLMRATCRSFCSPSNICPFGHQTRTFAPTIMQVRSLGASVLTAPPQIKGAVRLVLSLLCGPQLANHSFGASAGGSTTGRLACG